MGRAHVARSRADVYTILMGLVSVSTIPVLEEALQQASREALGDAKLQSNLLTAGSPIQFLAAPEFAAFWAADAKRLADVVRRIGRVDSLA